MRVLNIDLDFFLNDRVTGRADSPDSRPGRQYKLIPWAIDDVVKYIEITLNLKSLVPGRVVEHHHEVFYHWRDLIEREKLSTPFFISHVDAHADLGLGMPAWVYLHSKFLELPVVERSYPMEGNEGLNFGSYMSFAIGNHWLSEIDFVVPSFWHDDIHRYLLTDKCLSVLDERFKRSREEFIRSNDDLEIELMYAPSEHIEAHLSSGVVDFRAIRKSVGEPKIPLHLIPQKSVAGRYEGQKWDYVYLSHSPGYVPKSADLLMPVISKYIDTT